MLSHGEVAGLEIAHKHAYDGKVGEVEGSFFVQALKNCDNVELRHSWYTYTLEAWETDQTTMLDIYKRAIPNDEAFIMTIAEKLRQEGRQEGVSLGESKKAKEIALAMLQNGLSIQVIARCVSMSESDVQSLKELLVH